MTDTKSHLSLLTFNTLGTPFLAPMISQRYHKIAEILNNEPIDIICFQEVQTYYHLHLLKSRLKNFRHVSYQRFLYGPKGGLAVFSKLPFENKEYMNFSQLGSLKNSTFYSRIVRNGILVSKLKNLPMHIINTHLTTDFEFDWSPKNKYYGIIREQVREAAELVNKLSTGKQHIIITGDFNIRKNSKLYNTFLKLADVEDVFEKHISPTYSPERLNYLFKAKRSERVDYVFLKKIKPEMQVLSTSHMFENRIRLKNRINSFLSDHVGLKVDFTIK